MAVEAEEAASSPLEALEGLAGGPRCLGEASQRYEFAEEMQSAVGSWHGAEERGVVEKPWRAGSPCHVFRLRGFLPIEDARRVLDCVRADAAAYRLGPDSVDGAPTFEYYPLKDGRWCDEALRGILEGFVEERLLPYVRRKYDCGTCALADVLVRRYVPGERRTHAAHFDGHALVTAVLGLSDPSDYAGGLYLQPEPHVSSRRFPLIEPGDVLLHSFDVQHGVFVWGGTRYSLVFWIKDSPESVSAGTTPWYDAGAAAGDADALYNVAQAHECGIFGRSKDLSRAISLYGRSAAMGHHFAQYNLGRILARAHQRGVLTDGADSQAVAWLRAAAEQGFAVAQKALALALVNGRGVRQDCAEGAVWMRRAAEQLELEAAYFMGEFYLNGCGTPRDAGKAADWFARSAEAGYPEAQRALGTLLFGGEGMAVDLGRAELWLGCAAAQGDAEAEGLLAKVRRARARDCNGSPAARDAEYRATP